MKSYELFILLFAGICLLISCGTEEPEIDQHFVKADQIVKNAVNTGYIPGAVLLIGNSKRVLFHQSYGFASLYDRQSNELVEPERMTPGHQFDIASMTKIFATTYGLMLLHSRGILDVDAPVSSHIEAFETEEKKNITIRHLLTHTSGLLQWHPTYYTSNNPKERLEFISYQPLIKPIGEQRHYSDPGFMVLADLIEIITGGRLENFVENEIYQSLGLRNTVFNPDPDRFPDIVSTSHGNPFEKRMVYDDDFGYTVDVEPDSWVGWREYVLRGEVNDGNAYYTHNGVAGHAGLFSTAEDLYHLSTLMLNDGQFNGYQLFTPDTIRFFLTPDRFGHGLGFMMNSGSLHAKELPEGSLGHTGFTGTNFVVIPENDLIIILLTNRQHFGVNEDGYYPNLRELRENVLEAILEEN